MLTASCVSPLRTWSYPTGGLNSVVDQYPSFLVPQEDSSEARSLKISQEVGLQED